MQDNKMNCTIVKCSMTPATILLCGVGGQGTILAADLLAKTAGASGKDVKLSEIHGMSQRGGAVTTTVRYGHDVHTMITDPGTADVIVAFEKTEALRNAHALKKSGYMVVNDLTIDSTPVLTGEANPVEDIDNKLYDLGAILIDAESLALDAGNPKTANTALVGALSTYLEFKPEVWKEVIAARVPKKTIEQNLKAFDLGRETLSQFVIIQE